MNTYKIKALDGNKKLIFTVDAENLLAAQDEGRKKMKREGISNGLLDTITEVGPSKPEPDCICSAEGSCMYHRLQDEKNWVKCSGIGCETRIPSFGFCSKCGKNDGSCSECGVVYPNHDSKCGSTSMDIPAELCKVPTDEYEPCQPGCLNSAIHYGKCRLREIYG